MTYTAFLNYPLPTSVFSSYLAQPWFMVHPYICILEWVLNLAEAPSASSKVEVAGENVTALLIYFILSSWSHRIKRCSLQYSNPTALSYSIDLPTHWKGLCFPSSLKPLSPSAVTLPLRFLALSATSLREKPSDQSCTSTIKSKTLSTSVTYSVVPPEMSLIWPRATLTFVLWFLFTLAVIAFSSCIISISPSAGSFVQ